MIAMPSTLSVSESGRGTSALTMGRAKLPRLPLTEDRSVQGRHTVFLSKVELKSSSYRRLTFPILDMLTLVRRRCFSDSTFVRLLESVLTRG